MTTKELEWLRGSFDLLSKYNHDEKIRELVNNSYFYNSRSVFFYIQNLIQFSPKFYGYYRKIFRYATSYFANKKTRLLWKNELPDKFADFFFFCEQDTAESARLVTTLTNWAAQPSYYTPEQLAYLSRAEQITDPTKKQTAFDKFLEKIDHQQKINEQQVQQAFDSLSIRIKKNSAALGTLDGRKELIKKKVFSRKEIDAIFAANLLANIPNSQSFNTNAGLQSQRQWNRDVLKISLAIQASKDPVKEFNAPPGTIPNKQFPMITPLPMVPITGPGTKLHREVKPLTVSYLGQEPPQIVDSSGQPVSSATYPKLVNKEGLPLNQVPTGLVDTAGQPMSSTMVQPPQKTPQLELPDNLKPHPSIPVSSIQLPTNFNPSEEDLDIEEIEDQPVEDEFIVDNGEEEDQPEQPQPSQRSSSQPSGQTGDKYTNPAKLLGKRGTGQGLGRAATQNGTQLAAKTATRAAIMNPWVLGAIAILCLLFLLPIFFDLLKTSAPFSPGGLGATPAIAGELVKITKTGTPEVGNPGDPDEANIVYVITVTYLGPGTADIEVSDEIDPQTEFISSNHPPSEISGQSIKWTLPGLTPNKPEVINLTVNPTGRDFYAVNQASANVTNTYGGGSTGGTSGYSGTGLLPATLPPPPSNWEAIKREALQSVNKFPSNIDVYKEASAITGVPWELLAGIHYVEGNSNSNQSLVSGRPLNTYEPDIPVKLCNKISPGPADPIRIGAGCGFDTLIRSAVYGGELLKEKIGKVPETFQEAVTALSKYNGGGNRNCYLTGDVRNPRTIYQHCPREFEGEDDIYPMSQFDQKHSIMYKVYCGDGTPCATPELYKRLGIMTIVRALLEK